MLPKEFRLKHKKDFEILFKEGFFCSSVLLGLKIWQIQPEKYPRRNYSEEDLKIGFVVSNKISKNAVYRNRIKRQMREVVRLVLKDKRIKRGFFMAFVAKQEVLGKKYKEIEENMLFLLEKTKVLL